MAETSRSVDLSPSEIEGWVDDHRQGMENALRANPLDVRQEYEEKLRDLHEDAGEFDAYGLHGGYLRAFGQYVLGGELS